MKHAVLLVKNGIGFGHIRRALLIAEAVQHAGKLRPIIISQASSLALYHDSAVRVINFPLLHRVPSAIAEDLYTDLLNQLLDRLDPAVVIEDTYPDARYRRLPALADRPRILVMRRLDGLSFDQIRERGDLAHYDRILIAQDEAAFQQEGHSGDSLAAIRYSGRFSFVGNVAHTPGSDEIRAARHAYAPDGVPLVVVNGGAGDAVAALQEVTGGRGVDVSFEVIGSPDVILQAFLGTRRGGKTVVVGVAPATAMVSLPGFLLPLAEKSLVGSLYGSADMARDVPRLIALYRAGKLKLDELVTRRFALSEVGEAFAALQAGDVARGVITF